MVMTMVIGNSDGPPYSVRSFYAVEAPFQSICKWTAYWRMDQSICKWTGPLINGLDQLTNYRKFTPRLEQNQDRGARESPEERHALARPRQIPKNDMLGSTQMLLLDIPLLLHRFASLRADVHHTNPDEPVDRGPVTPGSLLEVIALFRWRKNGLVRWVA